MLIDVTKPVETVLGCPVTFTGTSPNSTYCLMGVVTLPDGNKFKSSWTATGRYVNKQTHQYDLRNVPEKAAPTLAAEKLSKLDLARMRELLESEHIRQTLGPALTKEWERVVSEPEKPVKYYVNVFKRTGGGVVLGAPATLEEVPVQARFAADFIKVVEFEVP